MPVDLTSVEQIVIARANRKPSQMHLIQHMSGSLYLNLEWSDPCDGVKMRVKGWHFGSAGREPADKIQRMEKLGERCGEEKNMKWLCLGF
jgi:hypothetical protein